MEERKGGRKGRKKEKKCGYCYDKPNHMCLMPLELTGGLWNTLEIQNRETIECCKSSLLGLPGGILEDYNAE